MKRAALPCLFLGIVLAASGCARRDAPTELRWWRGNTHTHTLWSDGTAAPEVVVDWYREKGYHFLVLSDHNKLPEGDWWFPVSEDRSQPLWPEHLEELERRYGEETVEVRVRSGRREMRLHTLGELRERFETGGRFLLLQGEEISANFERTPVHVGGVNLAEWIEPRAAPTLRETIQRNIDAVIEQGRRLDRPVLAHLNHPNYGWALTPEDVAAIRGDRFFEVYNGHPSVHNRGDENHPGTERIWDAALTLRLTELGLGPLYGLATDDAHDYHERGLGWRNPGRGWVMVRAPTLAAGDIIEAMKRGDFYATSGVELADVRVGERTLEVEIAAEGGVAYTTRFIGTRRVPGGLGPVGEVLATTTGRAAVYRFRGDELYVRAQTVSSKPHPNPHAEGDHETAWVQPVVPDSRSQ